MRSTAYFILLALSACTKLYAQNIENGRVFDNRFENHSKKIQLNGNVKSIKEVDSLPHYVHSYGRNKNKAFYILDWTFNPDGNYKQQLEYRDDGSLAARTVFTYNNKGQLATVTHFDDGIEIWTDVCTVDVAGNTAKSELYFSGHSTPSGFTLVKYNKQGKIAEIQYKGHSKPLRVTTHTFDQNGNLINDETDGSKNINKYDEHHYLIETIVYTKKGEVYLRFFYKYDQLGNQIEVKKEVNGNPGANSNIVYIYVYDSHNNWIKKTGNDGYSRTVVERSITYY